MGGTRLECYCVCACVCVCADQLKLTAMVNGQSEVGLDTGNRLLYVPDSLSVVIKCNGTGVLNWTQGSGAAIPLIGADPNPPVIFQRTDVSISSQLLTIQPFSSEHRGVYSCSTLQDGRRTQESVFITSGKTLQLC